MSTGSGIRIALQHACYKKERRRRRMRRRRNRRKKRRRKRGRRKRRRRRRCTDKTSDLGRRDLCMKYPSR